MRIYLTGYMGSGKSRLGRMLAECTGMDFIDLDGMFEERFHISIADFFSKYDEEAFRRIERNLLLETTGMDRIIVSTGGGTPCFFDNMHIIKKSGYSVYLCLEPAVLVLQLEKGRKNRPLLKEVPMAGLEAHIKQHLAEREQFYLQSDLVVYPSRFTPEKCIEAICLHFGLI